MGHAHRAFVSLVDDRDPAGQVRVLRETAAHLVEEAAVDLQDDLQVPRQQVGEQVHRPLLQGLGQQGVVGVVEGGAGDRPGPLPVVVVEVDEQPHQLGHGDGRVGVVELHREVLVEVVQVRVLDQVQADHVLQGAGDEEILLPQAQRLALELLVVGIENLGDVLGLDLLRHRAEVVAHVEVGEIEALRRLGAPQPQGVDRVHPVAGNRRVVGDAPDHHARRPLHPVAAGLVVPPPGAAAEADLHRQVRLLELPGVAGLQPAVAHLPLPAVVDGLVEHAELVADAVTDGRDFQGGERVQVAGGQPTETAVAEPRFLLMVDDLLQVEPCFLGRAGELVPQAEAEQVVLQLRPHEEFGREVADDAALALPQGGHRVDEQPLHAVAQGGAHRQEVVVERGVERQHALLEEQLVGKGALGPGNRVAVGLVFAGHGAVLQGLRSAPAARPAASVRISPGYI